MCKGILRAPPIGRRWQFFVRRMLVTTTAIYGNKLEDIKVRLKEQGMIYAAELTTSTRVVVAGNSGGVKCRVAQERGVPCVTPAWVLLGRCSMEKVGDFEVNRSLLGLEVCSTSLTMEERVLVRRVCGAHQARYSTSLTLKCALLVAPNKLSALSKNRKLQFAEKNHIYIISHSQFMEQYDYAVETLSVSAPFTCQTLSGGALGMVVYCSPAILVTETVKSLLDAIGARHVSMLTLLTTHVVLLGPTEEVFFPRPGLEFVSFAWLEECAAQQKCVSVERYRVNAALCPVITFTRVPQKERVAFRTSIEESGLPCFLQEDFVLGRTADEFNNQRNTTHLVVGRSEMVESSKVAALAWRIYKLRRRECFLVDVEWVICSLEAGRWLDCSYFTLEMPQLYAFGKALMRKAPIAVVATADMKNRDENKEEEGNVSYSFLENMQSDTLPPQSLEQLIEGLESKTNGYNCALTASINTAPQSSGISNMLFNEGVKNHSCVGEHVYAPELLLSSCNTGVCALPPMGSQVILYRRGDFEQPRKTLRQQEQKSASLGPEGTVDIVDTVVGAALEGGLGRSGVTELNPTGRVCRVMIAKSLQHMAENFERLQTLGFILAKTVEECTHYVTGKPSRTEFFLCSVAAGKWVLAPSFLEETLRAGRIAPEEAHEWRPEIAMAAQLRNSMTELVKACGLQRRRAVRPFASWCVVLCCATESRTESFSRVLRCGGCSSIFFFSPSKLLDTLASDPDLLKDVTFVLSDDNLWGASQLGTIAAHMPVLRMEYIAHCLCVEKTEPNKYILQANSVPLRKRLKNEVG